MPIGDKTACIFVPLHVMKCQFLIAAPFSGSGKTTVARGLMALFAQQGCRVQPFKCGPDYIDTKFHAAVCGRPSVNLDTFMASPAHVQALFGRYGADADACVVEGMMGLFDGYDRERGSSYEIARVLALPVVLVVDARSAAYSMAALLSGFIRFRDDICIAGVIFNKVGSERHCRMLRQVCDDLHLTCYGCLPKHAALEQESRYLGLDYSGENVGCAELLRLIDTHVRWRDLARLSVGGVSAAVSALAGASSGTPGHDACERERLRVCCARSADSFSFFYQEVLDGFGQVCFFNPEHEVPRLDGIDLLYLPGGYPEKHAAALTKNEACRQAIRRYADAGGRIHAECGGMMYLCQSILTDGGEYEMCGVLPYKITARRSDRRLSLGYRRFQLDGKEYRGHEFHYTQFLGAPPASVATVYNARGEEVASPVLRYKNVLASYTHLYQL